MPPSVCSSRCMSTQQNKSHPQPIIGEVWTEKSTARGLRRALSCELWAPAGPVWRQMWRSWVLDTASHSSAPPDEKYLQIEKSVSFNLVLMFLICGQCLKCQELDPEAVRGPGMWPRLIWASIKSIKRIWIKNRCYFLEALLPEFCMEEWVIQFLLFLWFMCSLFWFSRCVGL